MTAGLTVSLWPARQPDAPPGWSDFVAAQQLPAMWTWPLVHLAATEHRTAILAGTVHDGPHVRGVLTGRFTGVRFRRGAAPVAGVFDVDCLLSASMPGIQLDRCLDSTGHAEPWSATVAALRAALRHRYGRRVPALMLRQVGAAALPAVLRWPAIVREGGPIAVFHNTFTDVDAYLGRLSSARRKSLRRMVRNVDADPAVVMTSTFGDDVVVPPLRESDVQALHGHTVDRHHTRWFLRRRVVSAAVARAQLDHPEVDWIAYHDRAGTLLAYGSLWRQPDWAYAGLSGALPLAEGGRKDLWFHRNLQLVRWCVESGRSGFVSGQGSVEAKRRLGYDLRRQWAVLLPQ